MSQTSENTGRGAAANTSFDGPRATIDFATLLGLLGGFSLVAMALYLGGAPSSFVDVPSILIVIGGTFAITTICFSIGEIFQAQRVVFKTLVYSAHDPAKAAIQSLTLAKAARKRGILALQSVISQLDNEPFLQKGLNMIIDGLPGEDVERLMGQELQATRARHTKSVNVLRKAAEVSPAMGLIGTLIGLVQMLGNLDDPKSIGPAMAVALLTTFYGAVLSNMVFSPLASKLERNSKEENLINSVFLLAAASIGKQENPRRLEMLVNSLLPPGKRVKFFD